MIYTCYEMIRDCRQDKPAGWSYFITNYVPVAKLLLAHYDPEGARLDDVLDHLRANLFAGMEAAPERQFVAVLRQKVLERVPADSAAPLDLAILGEALGPLSVVEKETVWLETMGYSARDASRMLRMDTATAEKIRARAGESIRGRVDRWSSTMLSQSGLALGREAAAQTSDACIDAARLLDIIDGRATWQARQEMERHAAGCWHCIDHFCRLHEVCDLLRAARPLAGAEAEPYRRKLGIPAERKRFWQRV